MPSFAALAAELDAWTAAKRSPRFWWRDDDAVRIDIPLERLVELAGRFDLPLALAVIPGLAEDSLGALSAHKRVTVLQHGFRHTNHAGEGQRALECGGARSLEEVLAEFGAGFRILRDRFGAQFLPVMVPPWNRIDPLVLVALPVAGYAGFSVFGPARGNGPAALKEVNTHLDILTWRGGARFAGEAKLLALLVEGLAARRTGALPEGEPVGLLTHHRVHDPDAWFFLEALLGVLAHHPAPRWLNAAAGFGLGDRA